MVKRVEWRQKALRHLGEILFYLRNEVSQQAAFNGSLTILAEITFTKSLRFRKCL